MLCVTGRRASGTIRVNYSHHFPLQLLLLRAFFWFLLHTIKVHKVFIKSVNYLISDKSVWDHDSVGTSMMDVAGDSPQSLANIPDGHKGDMAALDSESRSLRRGLNSVCHREGLASGLLCNLAWPTAWRLEETSLSVKINWVQMNKSWWLDSQPGGIILHHTPQYFSFHVTLERIWYVICMWVNVFQTKQAAVHYLCMLSFKL